MHNSEAHCGGDLSARDGSLEAPISGPLYVAPQPGLAPLPTPAALLLNNSLGLVVCIWRVRLASGTYIGWG